jgi:hypothetical protein
MNSCGTLILVAPLTAFSIAQGELELKLSRVFSLDKTAARYPEGLSAKWKAIKVGSQNGREA